MKTFWLEAIKNLRSKIGNFITAFRSIRLSKNREQSIRNKLLFYFLLISLGPILIIGIISYQSSRNAMSQKIINYSTEQLTQTVLNLQVKLKAVETISNELSGNRQFNKVLINYTEMPETADLSGEKSEVSSFFNGFMYNLSNDIFAFMFIDETDNNRSIIVAKDFYSGFEDLTTTLGKTKIYRSIKKADGNALWSQPIPVGNSQFVMLARTVKNLTTGETLGILGIFVDESTIDELLNYTSYNKRNFDINKIKNYTITIDRSGTIISTPFKAEVGGPISKLLAVQRILSSKSKKQPDNQDYGSFFTKAGRKRALITYKAVDSGKGPSGNTGWYLLSISPIPFLFAEIQAVGWLTFFLGLIITVIAIYISLQISLSIANPLTKLVKAMSEAEKGNLVVRAVIKNRDELGYLGNSFNHMLEQISRLIVETKQAVDVVLERSSILETTSVQSAQTAESIATAMEQISNGTSEQTVEVEKTSKQTVNLAVRIDNLAARVNQVDKITTTTRELSYKSKNVVEVLIQKATETDQITEMILRDINQLISNIGEIRSITEAIAGIADQSNLLALNAAIEAARAGESGRGFTVVAEEINKLAAQSSEAARTIDNILKTIQSQTDISEKTANQVHQIVGDQMAAVSSAQKSFDEIIAEMDQITASVSEISEMIRSIDEFKTQTIQSISNISAVSEETAASAEEVSASSEEQTAISEQVRMLAAELRGLAVKLAEVVDRFQITE